MITKLYNYFDSKDLDETLAFGLAGGLACGLADGLACGLAFGLAFGLACGLINLSQLMPINLYSIIALILGTLFLMELLYTFNDKKKNPSVGYIIWLKIDGIITSLIIIINSLNIVWLFRHYKIDFDVILRWIGYIGVSILSLAVIAGICYATYKILIIPWLEWNRSRITIESKPRRR